MFTAALNAFEKNVKNSLIIHASGVIDYRSSSLYSRGFHQLRRAAQYVWHSIYWVTESLILTASSRSGVLAMGYDGAAATGPQLR